MNIRHILPALTMAGIIVGCAWSGTGRGLEIYWTDVEGGGATLIVTPAGESILIDTGLPGERDPVRIADTVRNQAGLQRIDHLVVTHFDRDHYGGTADLAKLLPIERVYDPGLPRDNDRLMQRLEPYLEAVEGRRTVLKPGGQIPLKQRPGTPELELRCLVAAKKFVEPPADSPLNPLPGEWPRRDEDRSRNANSIVLLLTFGSFRFLDAADLTWNLEERLVRPHNLVGKVDVFQVNHHGLDHSNHPALIRSIEPRVAVMNNGARKGCEPGTFKTLMETPGFEALYQLHRNVRVGPEGNTDPRRIANPEEECRANGIQLTVEPDGRRYTVSIPAAEFSERFMTRP